MKYLILLSLLITTAVIASGDKVKNPWQPTDTDQVSAFLPAGMDLNDCRLLASTQAGATYLCPPEVFGDEVVVTVPVETKD